MDLQSGSGLGLEWARKHFPKLWFEDAQMMKRSIP